MRSKRSLRCTCASSSSSSSLDASHVVPVLSFPLPADDLPPHFSKRAIADEASWRAPTSSDDVIATKRFNEFVGKRASDLLPERFEIAGENLPDGVVYKRFLTKRNTVDSPAKAAENSRNPKCSGEQSVRLSLHKRTPLDLFGKRVKLPYEFVGKRIFGHAWERVSTNTVEGDAQFKDVTDILTKRRRDTAAAAAAAHEEDHGRGDKPKVSRRKRYAEWLGKRGGAIADQLLRDLVNKRISAIMRSRLQNSANPEFIGRREEENYLPLPADLDLKKRYTEFIGK